MPYNGAGTFTSLGVPTFPAVTGDYILASYFNATMNDVFLGLSMALPRDGQAAMSANLPMGAFKITGLANGGNPQDATTFLQVFTSPTFSNATLTGVPVAPTAAYGTNTTQIATMAAIQAAVALLPSGALPSVTGKNTSWVLTPNAGGTAVLWTQKSPVSTATVLTSSTTWVVPADVTKVKFTVVGGGGGGNANSGSGTSMTPGGGAGTVISWETVTPGMSFTVTIGAGGAGATTDPGNGTTGGTSSVDNGAGIQLIASGGAGAAGTTAAGGAAANGDINIPGGSVSNAGADAYHYMSGGGSLLAMPAGYGLAGTGYGGGGGAAVIGGTVGFAGSAGVVIVEY